MMSVMCYIGIHRYGRKFAGSSWHPDLEVLACVRCGREAGQ